ncbi:MAG: hypothetical protein A3K03_07240 [Bdellovibrionales bacterium RIFOXYD1_FULL_44_7]|nr:MAG: hypothetical protein A3K03_07240 [Bdellovibrionales bacterium RIFOXYD1_FULL_44_7]
MRKNLGILFLIVALAMLNACSSSKTSESESPDELPPAEEVSTDEVPLAMEDPEQQEVAEPSTEPPVETAVAPPVQEATPESPTPTVETVQYTVQEGETLMKIAFETYGDLYKWKSIFEANKEKITDPNSIPKGTIITLEKPETPFVIERSGEKYLIKLGDTLVKISDDIYGTSAKWRRLWQNNRQLIKDPNKIFAGFYLYYTMTPGDQQEADQLKQQLKPAPLANSAPQVPENTLQPMGVTTEEAGAERTPATGTGQ